MEGRLEEGTVQVPKNTGVSGFLRAIQDILKLPRIQSVFIDARGKVTYRRYVVNGDRREPTIDFEGVAPYAIIRNGDVEEVSSSAGNAAVTIASMLDKASNDGLYSAAFVTGANTILWEWYIKSTGFEVFSRKFLCGLPVYQDRGAPDSALILCASNVRSSDLIDCQKSYKLEMEISDFSSEVEVI